MKYSEFNNKYPDLELQYTDVMLFIYCDGVMVGKVSKKFRYKMSTMYDGFEQFKESYAANLMMHMNMLSETPLAEREEEKRYRLKLTLSAIDVDENMYLALDQETNYKYLKIGILNANDYMVQDIFTESEIAQMDITGFEKVEVEE